jgi:hypothetical protein
MLHGCSVLPTCCLPCAPRALCTPAAVDPHAPLPLAHGPPPAPCPAPLNLVAAMVFLMTVFVWFLVPETKGCPLEEV